MKRLREAPNLLDSSEVAEQDIGDLSSKLTQLLTGKADKKLVLQLQEAMNKLSASLKDISSRIQAVDNYARGLDVDGPKEEIAAVKADVEKLASQEQISAQVMSALNILKEQIKKVEGEPLASEVSGQLSGLAESLEATEKNIKKLQDDLKELTESPPTIISGGGGGGHSKASAVILIATADAPTSVKQGANFVLRGSNDGAILTLAFKAMTERGSPSASGTKCGSLKIVGKSIKLNSTFDFLPLQDAVIDAEDIVWQDYGIRLDSTMNCDIKLGLVNAVLGTIAVDLAPRTAGPDNIIAFNANKLYFNSIAGATSPAVGTIGLRLETTYAGFYGNTIDINEFWGYETLAKLVKPSVGEITRNEFRFPNMSYATTAILVGAASPAISRNKYQIGFGGNLTKGIDTYGSDDVVIIHAVNSPANANNVIFQSGALRNIVIGNGELTAYTDNSAGATNRIITPATDTIKLDDLTAPDDNTNLNASATAHGLLPKLANTATKYLRDDGTWQTIAGGGDLVAANNLSDVASAATSLSNLGGIAHSLATAANDFLVASGIGAFVKKTLAETKVILDWAADIATHAALTTGVHGVGAGTVAKTADIAATKIDDLTAGDDNTDLDTSTTRHGLTPKAVAPAANVLNVMGIANGETALTNKAIFDATNPADVGTAAPGTSLVAAHRDHVHAAPASSTTVSGIVEASIASEVTTGTDAARSVTPDSLAGSDYGKRVVGILVNDSTALTSGDGKAYFRIPSTMNGWNLVAVAAHMQAGTGLVTIMIYNVTQAADFLSTALTIDANETDSSTAAAAAVIDTLNDDVATADWIRIDIDGAGTGTTWLYLELQFQLP